MRGRVFLCFDESFQQNGWEMEEPIDIKQGPEGDILKVDVLEKVLEMVKERQVNFVWLPPHAMVTVQRITAVWKDLYEREVSQQVSIRLCP